MLNLSLEKIDFQANDPVVDQLTEVFETMRQECITDVTKDSREALYKHGPKIEKIVRDRFNISIFVDPELWVLGPAAVLPFQSVFATDLQGEVKGIKEISQLIRNIAEDYDKSEFEIETYEQLQKRCRDFFDLRTNKILSLDGKSGTVDQKKVKVYGFFSEVQNVVILDPYPLFTRGDFTARELTAIFLHEIGHIFLGFSDHMRFSSTNLVFEDIMDSLVRGDKKKATYILKNNIDSDIISDTAIIKDLENDAPVPYITGNLVNAYIKAIPSNYVNQLNDFNTEEQSADAFVARFGLGKDLVSALNLCNKQGIIPFDLTRKADYLRRTKDVIKSFLRIITITGGVSVAVSSFFGTLITLPVFFGILGLTSFMTFRGGLKAGKREAFNLNDNIYDETGDRERRVMREIAGILKDRNLPKEIKKDLVGQYDFIKIVSDQIGNRRSIWMELATRLIPSVRKEYRNKERQQQIEEIMNNPLFKSTAEIETL